MIKRFYIILILSFLCINLIAQERFYYLYDGWTIKLISNWEDSLISVGLQTHPTTSGNIPQFNLISYDGTESDSFSYYNDTIDGLESRMSKSHLIINDDIFFVGTLVDYFKSYSLTPVLVKYSLANRDISYLKQFDFDEDNFSINYLIDSVNNGLIIVGDYNYSDCNSFPIIVFTNIIGDTLLTKKYEFLPVDPIRRRVFPYQILILPNNEGFLLSCQDEKGNLGAYHADVQSTCFLRLDSEGNELWRSYTTTIDTITFHPFAALLPDGDYFIAWSDPFLRDDGLNPDRDMCFARMNDDGIIYGKKKLSDDIEGLENKRYFINDHYQDESGNVFLTGEMSYPHNSFLLKIDSLGSVKWFMEYECFPENDIENKWTKIYGLTNSDDGGFIMGGEYMSSDCEMFPGGIQKGLVIKVDSCGCLEEGCNSDCISTYSKHDISASKADIFPNPANEWVTISIPTQTKNGNIQIFDIKGCEWVNTVINSENSKIEISSLPNGIYTVNIWSNGKLFTGKFVKE